MMVEAGLFLDALESTVGPLLVAAILGSVGWVSWVSWQLRALIQQLRDLVEEQKEVHELRREIDSIKMQLARMDERCQLHTSSR